MLHRLPRSLRPACFLLGAGAVAYAGCSSGGSAASAVTHPTLIEVAPSTFLGDLPCTSDGEGPGVKRYVATLIDSGYEGEGGSPAVEAYVDAGAGELNLPLEGEVQLASSAPTSCLASVGFGYVVSGRRYRVVVDAYDTDEVAPRALGSRQMVSTATEKDPNTAPLLDRAWWTSCESVTAVGSTVVRAEHCAPLSPQVETDAPGSIAIAVAPLLGELTCGSGPDQVDHLVFELGDEQFRVPCGAEEQLLLASLPPNQRYDLSVTAFGAAPDAETAAPVLAGSTCSARVLPGTRVTASCGQLSKLGTLRVDLGQALDLLGLGCNDIAFVDVKVAGEEKAQRLLPAECPLPFERGFQAGIQTVTLTAFDGDGELGSVLCHGEVAPGKRVSASCED
jgi:hypothetical protein